MGGPESEPKSGSENKPLISSKTLPSYKICIKNVNSAPVVSSPPAPDMGSHFAPLTPLADPVNPAE